VTATMDPVRAGLPARAAALVYGTLSYAAFLAVFLYAIAFVEDARLSIGQVTLVARTVDHGGTVGSAATALVVDALLLMLFAVQHSVMARPGFKRWWTRLVPAPVERSTYVLLATACLAVLMAFWRPLPGIAWDVPDGIIRPALIGVSLAGWLIVLSSTFLINHLDLFGLRQVIAHTQGRRLPSYRFGTPLWYALVRHPIYLGFLLAFWAAPTMTVGHLVFAVATTGYVLVGIQLEERDLVHAFGDEYRAYRRRVPMLIPGARRRA
jgi:protein-S-isoprenylcysteine O-methyltransferase Ste14